MPNNNTNPNQQKKPSLFERFVNGIKTFFQVIRDVAVSIMNRVIFGNKQAERLSKAYVDKFLETEKGKKDKEAKENEEGKKDPNKKKENEKNGPKGKGTEEKVENGSEQEQNGPKNPQEQKGEPKPDKTGPHYAGNSDIEALYYKLNKMGYKCELKEDKTTARPYIEYKPSGAREDFQIRVVPKDTSPNELDIPNPNNETIFKLNVKTVGNPKIEPLFLTESFLIAKCKDAKNYHWQSRNEMYKNVLTKLADEGIDARFEYGEDGERIKSIICKGSDQSDTEFVKISMDALAAKTSIRAGKAHFSIDILDKDLREAVDEQYRNNETLYNLQDLVKAVLSVRETSERKETLDIAGIATQSIKEQDAVDNIFVDGNKESDQIRILYNSPKSDESVELLVISNANVTANSDILVTCHDKKLLKGITFKGTDEPDTYLVSSKDIEFLINQSIGITKENIQKDIETAKIPTVFVYDAISYANILEAARQGEGNLDIRLSKNLVVQVREGDVKKAPDFSSKNIKSQKDFEEILSGKVSSFIKGETDTFIVSHDKCSVCMRHKGDEVLLLALNENEITRIEFPQKYLQSHEANDIYKVVTDALNGNEKLKESLNGDEITFATAEGDIDTFLAQVKEMSDAYNDTLGKNDSEDHSQTK